MSVPPTTTTTHSQQPSSPPPTSPPGGMENIAEVIGKGGKDEDVEGLIAQQMRWDWEDVLLLFQTLRGRKKTSAPQSPSNAKPEGAKAH